jgi:hypothetical protein
MATNGATAARPAPRFTQTRLLIVALGVVLLVQGLFVTSYVGALHRPQPHNVPFGITGSPKLAAAVGKQFSLRAKSYSDEAAARRAIDQRSIYGALITDSSGTTLLVAPAASNGVATALTTAFTSVAAATGQKLAVVQVHSLPAGDRVGIVPFLVTMALVIGGYLSATMATTLGGPAVRRHAPLLAGVAVLGALVTDLIAGPLLGGIPSGHFLELWGIFAFLMLAVAFAAAALQTLFGAFGTLIVIVVFVIFGAPAAGGSLASPLLPGFWGTIGPFLPPGAGTTAVRNTIYFDGNGIDRALLILLAYLVAGVAVVLWGRRPSTPQSLDAATDVETAGAAAAIV